jgi:hypothetical protein
MSAIDKLRSFAETSMRDEVPIRDGLTYGDVREALADMNDDPRVGATVQCKVHGTASAHTGFCAQCFQRLRDDLKEARENFREAFKTNTDLAKRLNDAEAEVARLRSEHERLRADVIERLRSFEPPEGDEIDLHTVELSINALETMWSNDDYDRAEQKK